MSVAYSPKADPNASFLADVLAGLAAAPKRIPPKYFYDEEGSQLFEQICRTPEYYPTRVETALLARIAPEIAARIPEDAVLVEFGSGASEKTRLLLDAAPQLSGYVPIDISLAALQPAAERIVSAYPRLRVEPCAGDFTQSLRLPAWTAGHRKIGFFSGSTIGNFDPPSARSFLRQAGRLLGTAAGLIVGVDLIKDAATLTAAYNDAEGVTAAFNLNLLARINRELGGDFDLSQFVHEAVWNTPDNRMEMHLRSLSGQAVHVAGRTFRFRAGETIHTENSYKYAPDSFAALAQSAGWRLSGYWISPPPEFGVFLLEQ